MTLTQGLFKGAQHWHAIRKLPHECGHIVYAGDEKLKFKEWSILPWQYDFNDLF